LEATEPGFSLLWPPYVIGQAIIFFSYGLFFLLSIYLSFFSSPNLSRHRLDVCHTSTVRISDVGLKRAARGSLQIQDARNCKKFAIWAPLHKFIGLHLCN